MLETEFDTPEGTVRVVDCMPIRDRIIDVVRIVEGVSGAVPMKFELVVRFDYGSVVPVGAQPTGNSISMIAGPNALRLNAPFKLEGADMRHEAEFVVRAGEKVPFVLTWFPSFHRDKPPERSTRSAPSGAPRAWWKDWSSRSTYHGKWEDLVQRSVITLKALTYAPTGGIVAAPTTSLPEWPGSVRNWDYRYCWLRDATFTLYSLMSAGYVQGSGGWRDWLLRAVAGDPAHLQIMYGNAVSAGSPSTSSTGSSGYERSAPVRVGNAASRAVPARRLRRGVRRAPSDAPDGRARRPERVGGAARILDFLEAAWKDPDEGIWEVRGGRRDFTHSKVMAWVAFDRAVKAVEQFGLDGPVDSVARHTRRSAPGGVRARLRRRAQHLHAVLRLEGARREPR